MAGGGTSARTSEMVRRDARQDGVLGAVDSLRAVSDRSSSYVRGRIDAFRLTFDERLYPDTHKPLVTRAGEIKAMLFRGPET